MSAGAIGGTTLGATDAGSNAFGSLKSDDFIRVLLSELTNQDPFEPQDSAALLEQLSNIRNIEGQLSLQEQLQSLVLQNQISAAGGLIGKVVTGLNASNNAIQGLVTSVRVQGDQTLLELDTGKTLAMGNVTRITDPQG